MSHLIDQIRDSWAHAKAARQVWLQEVPTLPGYYSRLDRMDGLGR